MDIMNILLANMPSGFWQSIIGWFSDFIVSYGWTIIVFTICLKLVLSPLDFFQRSSMRKTQKQQALIKPELDKIKEKYGDNKEVVNQKTMELYQKNKINPMAGCLGMIVNLVVTMVVFFTLWGAMNNISQYKIYNEYQTLQTEYVSFYNHTEGAPVFVITYTEYFGDSEAHDCNYLDCKNYGIWYYDNKATEKEKQGYESADDYGTIFAQTCGQILVEDKFDNIKESWLWVKNIFRPDNYSSTFPNYSSFNASTNSQLYAVKETEGITGKYYYKSEITGEVFYVNEDAQISATNLANAKIQGEKDFNIITQVVQKDYGAWNGYFILIFLAGASTVLSQLLTSAGAKAKNKKGEEVQIKGQTNKILMIVMPIIMVWFTWSYSAAFAVYIVVNSLMSALIGYIANLVLNKVDEKKEQKGLVTVSSSNVGSSKKGKSNIELTTADYRIEKKGKIVVDKSSSNDEQKETINREDNRKSDKNKQKNGTKNIKTSKNKQQTSNKNETQNSEQKTRENDEKNQSSEQTNVQVDSITKENKEGEN